MPSIETYRKQAKQLVRWHRERNYSIGEKVRLLERCRHLTDVEVLEMAMPLTLAQEVVAVEAGFQDWPALKAGADDVAQPSRVAAGDPSLAGAVPILFVRDVEAAAAFYENQLAFRIDFLHGAPPFYGSVSRDRACLHLRFVHEPNFAELAAREDSLILATIEVENVKALFQEYEARNVDFAQRLVRQAWGGLDFHVRDPDGNVVSFVQYRRLARQAEEEHQSPSEISSACTEG
jgi:catechol 2,3-dioxygenase-like lactoylglutathione lyase family enzyme